MNSRPNSWRHKLLRQVRRWADERFPLMFPVRVYMRHPNRMGECMGYFSLDDSEERGVIVLANNLDESGLIDCFLEEWAHARTAYLADEADRDDDPHHHPSFWAEYGRIVKASREVAW